MSLIGVFGPKHMIMCRPFACSEHYLIYQSCRLQSFDPDHRWEGEYDGDLEPVRCTAAQTSLGELLAGLGKARPASSNVPVRFSPILSSWRSIQVPMFKTSSRIFWFLLGSALSVIGVKAQPFAYVSNISGNNVSVVNTATNTVVSFVSVPAGPTGLAVMPDGSAVYVASQSMNNVSVINTSSNSVVKTISVGTTPVAIAINPSGTQAYVVDQGTNQISVIDTGSNAVIGTIAVGQKPTGVAFSPDGSRAFVPNLYAGNVSVINTATRTVVSTFAALSGPSSVAVAPNGTHVYVGNQYSNSLTVHNAATGSIVATVTGLVFPNAVAVTPNGSRVFVVNGNAGSVAVVDTTSNSVVATMPTGNLPTSVAVSPDGKHAYVTNETGLSLSVIDTATDAVVTTIQRVGIYPVAVAMVPPGGTCTYALSSSGTSIGGGGGTGTVSITAPTGCSWTASSDSSWLTVTSGFSGSGNGSVSFSVSANTSIPSRVGHLTIGEQIFTVTESGDGFSPIRINCGGPAMVDASGNHWAADNLKNHTETVAAITNTSIPALYTKESWSTGTLQYQFTVPNSSYTVKLHFAEIYLTQKGLRVFNIVINGSTVHASFDILGLTTPDKAYDVSFPVTVTGGLITIQLVPVMGSPKLSAIEIF